MKLKPWFKPPLIGNTLAKVKFKIASSTSIYDAHDILCTCSWTGIRDVPSKWRVCIETRCHITQGSCLPGFRYRSHGVIRRQESILLFTCRNLSLYFSTYTHILPIKALFTSRWSHHSIIITTFSLILTCICMYDHVESKRNMIGMTSNIVSQEIGLQHIGEVQKSHPKEPRRFIGQVGKDYPAAQQRPTPLERQWAEMRFGLSSILLFLLLVSLFLSLSLLAIPSLLLLYLSVMKNSHWGSALVNGIGLISNLMALYAANFVYENPYATGFGGHFQVGED